MDETTNLLLPYILAAQAQKHVTHNEALRKLDALVQISIVDRDLATPPPSPTEGARYIVASSPTGAWTGHVNKVAAWQDGAWAIFTPRKGWIAWIEDESAAVAWNGTAWTAVGVPSVNPASLVGVNATADATNRLAVSSAASLFNHAGAGHQVKVNKNLPADTASLLFQSGFSGRAEMGLAGNDDFSFKVSADGVTWFDAILINRANGACTFPNSSIGGGVSDGDKGDVVVSGGGASWIVDANAVTNTKLADMAALSVKGNALNAAADPSDIAATVDGHVLRRSGTMLGFGTLATAGVADDAITNAKLANMAANTLKGNNTGAAADPVDLTPAQATALLDVFSSSLKGLAPASGGGTANFLRADGTWAAPPGGGVTDGDKGDVTVSGGGATWTLDNGVITNAKLANVASGILKRRRSAGSGAPEDLTVNQAREVIRLNHGPEPTPLVDALSTMYGGPSGLSLNTTTAAAVANRWHFMRLCIARDRTLIRLATRVSTAVAGTTCRLALYGSLANGLPGALLVDSGPLPTDAVALVEATISQAVEAGRDYWLASWFSGTPTMAAVDSRQGGASIGFALTAGPSNAGYSGLIISGKTYGTPWPADVTGELWQASGVIIPFVAWR